MKRSSLAAVVAAVILVPLVAFAVFAQESAKPDGAPGRYIPMAPGVLDTSTGTIYSVDPPTPDEVMTLDLPGCRAFVRDIAKDASGWGAVELPRLDPAVVPARGCAFLPLGGNTAGTFSGVVDTRTGVIYSLVADETKGPLKVTDPKNARVVRFDPVLGTRTIRDLHVSKRGG